jgi:hypothetical protein
MLIDYYNIKQSFEGSEIDNKSSQKAFPYRLEHLL